MRKLNLDTGLPEFVAGLVDGEYTPGSTFLAMDNAGTTIYLTWKNLVGIIDTKKKTIKKIKLPGISLKLVKLRDSPLDIIFGWFRNH